MKLNNFIFIAGLAAALSGCATDEAPNNFAQCDQSGHCVQEFAKFAPAQKPGSGPTIIIKKWVSIHYHANDPGRQLALRDDFVTDGWTTVQTRKHPEGLALTCAIDFEDDAWRYALTCRSNTIGTISGTSVHQGPKLITRISAFERLHDMFPAAEAEKKQE